MDSANMTGSTWKVLGITRIVLEGARQSWDRLKGSYAKVLFQACEETANKRHDALSGRCMRKGECEGGESRELAVLRADEGETSRVWSSPGMKWQDWTGDPRENPPTSCIFRYDSLSGSDPAGNRARFAVVGGE
ncbi:hypothetical protein PR048_022887 [Dryococelus australis]|uniref:Uncharacterized protein n=1 Tax=Dryococelus australis TaxID=614101 RepID=A0ABQ9GSH1_9NEOP|nr:hypothetical protein PR048_022887 [Dryococelus australis]